MRGHTYIHDVLGEPDQRPLRGLGCATVVTALVAVGLLFSGCVSSSQRALSDMVRTDEVPDGAGESEQIAASASDSLDPSDGPTAANENGASASAANPNAASQDPLGQASLQGDNPTGVALPGQARSGQGAAGQSAPGQKVLDRSAAQSPQAAGSGGAAKPSSQAPRRTGTPTATSDRAPSGGALTSWQQGGVYGPWKVIWSGYGPVRGNNTTIELSPKSATSSGQSHAGLVVSTATYSDVEVRATVRTSQQLRSGSPANSWEVGWLVWRYVDSDRFYSILLKPNGWELIKHDPQYSGGQRYLDSGSSPRFAIGGSYKVHVTHIGNQIIVRVDGQHLTTFTDSQRPYSRGSVGFFAIDSTTTLSGISITPR